MFGRKVNKSIKRYTVGIILITASLITLFFMIETNQRDVTKASEKKVNQPSSKVSVRFPIPVVEAGQTYFYVAQDKGYYAEEGLNVTFNLGSRELNPVKMVETGNDTFGVLGGPDTLLVAISKGYALKAVSILHKNSNFPCLITLKSSGVTKLDQLQGEKIGFFYGHISTDVLRNFLRKEHIKYHEVDVGFDYNQLIHGHVAAEWAFTVTAGLELPFKGIPINIISPADYGITTDGYTIFAKNALVEKDPELVKRFLRATFKGIAFTIKHPEEALESLLKRNSNLNHELSLKRLKEYILVTSSPEYGFMDKTMFETAYRRLKDENVIKHDFNISRAFTTEILSKIEL